MITTEEFETFTKAFMEANDLKLKTLGPILRIAMVGSASSPSVFATMAIIGKEALERRIEGFLKEVG
jgi:glutamyl-tRNA synthetase